MLLSNSNIFTIIQIQICIPVTFYVITAFSRNIHHTKMSNSLILQNRLYYMSPVSSKLNRTQKHHHFNMFTTQLQSLLCVLAMRDSRPSPTPPTALTWGTSETESYPGLTSALNSTPSPQQSSDTKHSEYSERENTSVTWKTWWFIGDNFHVNSDPLSNRQPCKLQTSNKHTPTQVSATIQTASH